jgi:hypothetical protein
MFKIKNAIPNINSIVRSAKLNSITAVDVVELSINLFL